MEMCVQFDPAALTFVAARAGALYTTPAGIAWNLVQPGLLIVVLNGPGEPLPPNLSGGELMAIDFTARVPGPTIVTLLPQAPNPNTIVTYSGIDDWTGRIPTTWGVTVATVVVGA